MNKTNLAIVPTTPKPLTADEARAGIDRTEGEMAAAIAQGDQDGWLEGHRRRLFFLAALEAAEQRVAHDAELERKRQIDALKPEAEKWVRAANPETFAAAQMAEFREGFALILGALRQMPEATGQFKLAQETASRLSKEARVAYAGAIVVDEGFVGDAIRRVWLDALDEAKLPESAARFMPGLHVGQGPSAAAKRSA